MRFLGVSFSVHCTHTYFTMIVFISGFNFSTTFHNIRNNTTIYSLIFYWARSEISIDEKAFLNWFVLNKKYTSWIRRCKQRKFCIYLSTYPIRPRQRYTKKKYHSRGQFMTCKMGTKLWSRSKFEYFAFGWEFCRFYLVEYFICSSTFGR